MTIPLSLKILLFYSICFVIPETLSAQIIGEELHEELDSEEEPFSISNLPYFLDDVMLLAGFNSGNVYWSNHFRELRSSGGFQIGFEGFIPLGQITFLDYGIQYAQRNFKHGKQEILFKNHFLDFPIYASFMLPELRSIDLRFFLGTQFSYRLSSEQSEIYPLLSNDSFQYDPTRFNRFDSGMTFGLSGEKGNFFFRLRSFVGISKIDRMDQGSMSAFFIEGGYFLFRGLRQ